MLFTTAETKTSGSKNVPPRDISQISGALFIEPKNNAASPNKTAAKINKNNLRFIFFKELQPL
jgi:hypothetical protein